jgi:hypothetical protein
MANEKELLEKKYRADAEIIVIRAHKRGLILDVELVLELLKVRVKFDRSMLSFLVKLQAAGKDPNNHLRDLKAELEKKPVEETKKGKGLTKLAKNTTECIDINLKRVDLRAHFDVEALQTMVDKATELIAACSAK